MPTIEFLSGSASGPSTEVRVEHPEGGALVDMCDESRAPVPFSCRSASCGTCRVEVLEGADLLEPPKPDELEVLEVFDSPPTHRLACQAVLRAGPGLVRLRAVDD